MRLVHKAIELAKAKRIKEGELATMIGTHASRLSEWKRGTGKPSIEQALRMARALGVPLDYLADDEEERPPPPSPELSFDEELALRYYRDLRATLGPHEAVRELARFTAAKTGHSVAVPNTPTSKELERELGPFHPTTWAVREREREARQPKPAGRDGGVAMEWEGAGVGPPTEEIAVAPAPEPPPRASGPARLLGRQDHTESDDNREREERQPKPAPPKKGGAAKPKKGRK